jgi:uncharacterized Tic20 family protein
MAARVAEVTQELIFARGSWMLLGRANSRRRMETGMTQEDTTPSPSPAPVDYASAPGGDLPQPTKDESNMGVLMFILAIFTGFLGPLIVWLIKKNESRYIDAQGKEILNYIITVILAMLINIPLWFILIGILIHFGLIVASLVFFIIGAVRSSQGTFYRFPFAWRLLK